MKPEKPYPDFPLTAHPNGQWCKKIRGKVRFFGVWSDPQTALVKYLDQKDYLQAGRTPPVVDGSATFADLANLWLMHMEARKDAGDLSSRTFVDYRDTLRIVSSRIGSRQVGTIQPPDWTELRTWAAGQYSPSRLTKIVSVIRMMLHWCSESDYIDKPVKFGPSFKGASKKQAREQRNRSVKKLFTPTEVRRLIDFTSHQMRAAILLGINCGLGNTDISDLSPQQLYGNWLDCPRSKTSVERRCPLWPETVSALNSIVRIRPDRFFSTVGGGDLVKRHGTAHDELSRQFGKLLKHHGFYARGRSFYALRHTFQTVGEESGDKTAVGYLMGHVDSTMSGVYREEISDARLLKVTQHVREWLWG